MIAGRSGDLVWRAIALVLLGAGALVPLAVLLLQSAAAPWFYPALLLDALALDGWAAALSPAMREALSRSLLIGIMVAAVATPIAATVGRAVAQLDGWRLHLGAALVFLPVAAPPIAIATGLQVVILRAGAGGTTAGVVLAHLVPAVGYLTLYFIGVFRAYDDRVEEAARTLGASRWHTLVRVHLPLLRRPLAEAAMLGFLVSWAQYALTLVIGGGAVRTLPLTVYSLVRAGQDQQAAIGALLLITPAALALTALGLAARRTTVVAV
ncbi:MAG: ABC transporter permease subunit [Gemmatimonadaceae bacterium]|nr:ABC transporter permease subunit [Gemmatimonadaceae bacterium]